MITLCWLLILAWQFKGSSGQLLPHKVDVKITNMLIRKELTLHCKDKNHDLGFVKLKVGESFTFSFNPNFFADITLYFCRFIWIGGDHRFDIYVEHRDHHCNNNVCSWQISEKRPCDVSFGVLSRKCYQWDGTLPETNNTLSS
ncbi:hypothetical protein V8G54_013277 [Vigna mungo]|uniref:S-protein homolog n=1 Tax=Vigna mungo TaxID=3915 RepID=A0AAQ3NVD6_VIGMU